jgi:hypothetical protein
MADQREMSKAEGRLRFVWKRGDVVITKPKKKPKAKK